jgi:hypothetical protein
METAGQVTADPATRKKKGTYPDGCRLKFLSPFEEHA